MPEESGALTQAEVDGIAAWLNGHAGGKEHPCPICGEVAWTIIPFFVQPVTLGQNHNYNFGIGGYPQVMVVSLKCGYTRYINAMIAGVIKSTPQSS